MNITILESILLILGSVVVITTIFRQLHIPAIVGYILVGVLIGPNLLAWINNSQETRELALYGIVFLMFTLGLEFSLSRLLTIRRIVFGLGTLQVFLTIMLTTSVTYFLHANLITGFIIGSILAMSSTAIVTKQLTEQSDLNSEYGMEVVGILLFQDLAFVPLLILIPSLQIGGEYSLSANLFWSAMKGILAIVVILSIGRYLLRPLFYQITKRYSLELLTLSVLFIALSAAWLTHILGLSLALGAFLAGIMLGETEYRHQIEVAISPFRDVLLALFFISVGMQLNPSIISQIWPWVIWGVLLIIFSKIFIVFLLSLLSGSEKITATRTALALAQAGELGFVLLLAADSYHLLPIKTSQIILASMLLSMMASPILIQHNRAITNFIFRRNDQEVIKERSYEFAKNSQYLHDHIIICGYGRVGQNIARLLDDVNIRYIAFDLDASRVQKANLAGDNVYYADAGNYAILSSAQLQRAKALVISFNDIQTAIKISQAVRAEFKRIPIIIRSYDENDTNLLYQHGATEVIPETIETSLAFASHLFVIMHLPITKVHRLIDKIRQDRYAILQRIFPGSDASLLSDEAEHYNRTLHVIVLTEDAYAVGRKITELKLHKYDVVLVRIRRNNKQYKGPKPTMVLHGKDILVLYGQVSDLVRAERMIFEGKW